MQTLTTLLSILPIALAAPAAFDRCVRDSNPGCQAASFGDFEWTIQGFDYHASYVFTTPAHQNSWGYASFNLTNPALEYESVCSASSDQLSDFFYGTMTYNCTEPAGGEGTTTTFSYSEPMEQLNVTQKWTCSDEDPTYPTTFTAFGIANFTLSCNDTTWTNPDWTEGEIYSDRTVTCAPVTTPLKPLTISAVA